MKKNLKTLYVAIAILIFIVFIIVFISLKNNKLLSYNGITPSKSSKNDLLQTLGQPDQISTESGTTYEYKTNSPVRNDKYFLNDKDKVNLIKEIITSKDNIKFSDLIKKYGNSYTLLYGPDAQTGFNFYVYLEGGVAFIGNKNTEDVIEIWYFPKTDVQNFIKSYAPDYSFSYVFRQN